MQRHGPHRKKPPRFRIPIFLTRSKKRQRAIGNQETLIVHFIPVSKRSGAEGCDDEFSGSGRAVDVGAIF